MTRSLIESDVRRMKLYAVAAAAAAAAANENVLSRWLPAVVVDAAYSTTK